MHCQETKHLSRLTRMMVGTWYRRERERKNKALNAQDKDGRNESRKTQTKTKWNTRSMGCSVDFQQKLRTQTTS